jgi:methyl-accepting chemotaxis protein
MMKINMSVTNHEVLLDDTEFMFTKTDLKGNITFANIGFIKTSGYSEEELVGQNHNIVRHPDMPPEVFEDLWGNVKAGRPWTCLMKNLAKSGDYYWVEANVAPIIQNGQVVGYLSALKKPSRQQVAAAAEAYRLFKEGKAKRLLIRNGKVVKNNFSYNLKATLELNVGQRVIALIGLALMVAALLAAHGLYGLKVSTKMLEDVYEGDMAKVEIVASISENMLKTLVHLSAPLDNPTLSAGADGKLGLRLNPEISRKEAEYLESKLQIIDKSWADLTAKNLPPEEKLLADKTVATRDAFLNDIIKPAIVALGANDYPALLKLNAKSHDAFNAADKDITEMLKHHKADAAALYVNCLANYERTRFIAFSLLGCAFALLLAGGMLLMRSITNPLAKIKRVFDDIASDKLDTSIDTEGNDEFSSVLRALKTMQTMLNVDINQQRELGRKVHEQSVQYENQLAAISKSTGVIEFNMDGTVITANDIFLKVFGYSLAEIKGQHHGQLVTAEYRTSPDYKVFWERLNRGVAITGEFERVARNGKEVWLQASYNPILDATEKPYKVVKYATDITEQKVKNADFESQMTAISKSQGVVEVGLDGELLKANDVYLNMLGYTEKELVGQPSAMVLDPSFAKSEAFATLWAKVVKGGVDTGQYKRISKSGKEVWIQASYNPIYDLHGKPYKIVNYTIDITEQKLQAAVNAGQLAAIDKIQCVIEFDLTGKIIAANANFASAVGYSESEILGKHHSMFVDVAYRSSKEYKAFWEALARGEPQAGQVKRMAKGGKETLFMATHNPIMDINGKPFKIVKYATDITEEHRSSVALAEAVEETQAIIEAAKEGDLTSRVSLVDKVGAIASLCMGVNALMDQMTNIIVQVRDAGNTINTAAGEIASGNNDLSRRTENQADSLEKTASSMEELSSTVKQNADNAKQANQLATEASDVAMRGGKAVDEVVNTMSAINNSSKKIEDIISVIDGIAFQTNILALNAAVEAARAGEQGRGFAVVADEVRNLAQRSASAAKEIKELISDSVGKTAEGTKQVETAGSTMQEIVTSVKRVTDIMGEITAASEEQSQGIDQVNQAVTSIDKVTQQNASLVEQAAAAAESLVEQAASLIETVSAYKLSASDSNQSSTEISDANVISESAENNVVWEMF